MRRAVLALSAAAVLGGLAVPSFATSAPPVPVGVSHDNGQVCVWVSYQLPHCVDTGVTR